MDSREEPTPIRYLALGDSYTIGESVPPDQRWPVQLTEALEEQGDLVEDLVLVAQTGWTTDELLAGIEERDPQGTFELVTLLIGVNNQYRGGSLAVYEAEFRSLLEQAIGFAGGEAGRVVVLSIPDWSVTEYAQGRDHQRIAREIDQFNAVNRAEAEEAGTRYVDVTSISREAEADASLIAEDGLHPSGEMYRRWVELVLPEALAALRSMEK
jgi:lysophospholipase L1-like esterase